MKKIISILCISLLLSLSIKWDCIQGKSLSVNQTIISAFKSTDSDIISSNINIWGEFKGKLEITQMENMAKNIAKSLSIQNDSIKISKNYSDSLRQVMLRGQDEDESILTIKLDSLLFKDGKEENYLMVDVFHDGQCNLDSINSKLDEIYLKYNCRPHYNTCVTGTFDGKVSDQKSRKLEQSTLKHFGAKFVEGIRDRGVVSVSAYSPSISRNIKVGKNLINVNFAMRYNDQEDKTYMWIATPLITNEY